MSAPENAPENPLWLELSAIPRPFRVIDFPRKRPDGTVPQIHLHILSQEEMFAAQAAAERFTKQLLKEMEIKRDTPNIAYDTIYENAASVELLFRACRRLENPKWPFFPGPSEIRKGLSNDEIGVLVRAYLLVQAELGPIVAELTDGEVDAWIERIVKGGSIAPFASLSWEALSELTRRLAFRLAPSTTHTSSSGSPPATGGPGESGSG